MRLTLAALILSLATPALADTEAVIRLHILPAEAGFAARTQLLSEAAQADCTPAALRPAYQDAFDAWMGVSHLRLGPVEEAGRYQAIAFWPDARGLTEKTLRRLIADSDPVVNTPGAYSEVSVAARGLFALDLMLYDDDFADYTRDSYSCALVQAIAADLAGMAAAINDAWKDSFTNTLLTAGESGNTTYLAPREVTQALFTQLTTALEFNADQRLGQPMGTFDRPRPKRAEARRSDRPLRDVKLALAALRQMAALLADPPPADTLKAFDHALDVAARLDDPVFAGVDTPQGRLKVEVLQQAVRAARTAAIEEIGPSLGVSAGFNSADGD